MAVRFIPEELVLVMHADLLQRYGGQPGLRDRNLLESALAQPRATVSRKFAHKTIFEKAAAYGYHLCKNHPFIDGNKRVAFVLMDTFLQRNGWEIVAHEEDVYSIMVAVSSSRLSKPQLASWLKGHSSRLPSD
ncbi:MAG: type II toxin-antitoxin system death-on-curing family toxin [Candidatus Kryptoniota bacterium]